MNTQSITLQKKFSKKINGSFHGLWSLGGIAGVGFTTLMIALDTDIRMHFMIIAALVFSASILAFAHLLKGDKNPSPSKLMLKKPDPHIMTLGFLTLCAAICEGGMFDWSGVYFQEVIKVEIFTSGYLIFMTCMALSRFSSDWLIHRLGMQTMYILSAILIAGGLLLAIVFPTFWTALTGFSLVGLGTASVVPMTFTLAGTSKKYSAGMAISLIATYALVGMLLGPPLIGYLAQLFNLRVSFLFLAFAGMMIIPISRKFFQLKEQ